MGKKVEVGKGLARRAWGGKDIPGLAGERWNWGGGGVEREGRWEGGREGRGRGGGRVQSHPRSYRGDQ